MSFRRSIECRSPTQPLRPLEGPFQYPPCRAKANQPRSQDLIAIDVFDLFRAGLGGRWWREEIGPTAGSRERVLKRLQSQQLLRSQLLALNGVLGRRWKGHFHI